MSRNLILISLLAALVALPAAAQQAPVLQSLLAAAPTTASSSAAPVTLTTLTAAGGEASISYRLVQDVSQDYSLTLDFLSTNDRRPTTASFLPMTPLLSRIESYNISAPAAAVLSGAFEVDLAHAWLKRPRIINHASVDCRIDKLDYYQPRR